MYYLSNVYPSHQAAISIIVSYYLICIVIFFCRLNKLLNSEKINFSSHRAESVSFPPGSETEIIFGLDVKKNSIRSTGVKLASPKLVFATLAFGSGVNLHELWTVPSFFLPRCVIYY